MVQHNNVNKKIDDLLLRKLKLATRKGARVTFKQI